MKSDIQTLKNHALAPYFSKSKYENFIDQETYEANAAHLFNINRAADRLQKELNSRQ